MRMLLSFYFEMIRVFSLYHCVKYYFSRLKNINNFTFSDNEAMDILFPNQLWSCASACFNCRK